MVRCRTTCSVRRESRGCKRECVGCITRCVVFHDDSQDIAVSDELGDLGNATHEKITRTSATQAQNLCETTGLVILRKSELI